MPDNSFQLTPDMKYLIAIEQNSQEVDSVILNSGDKSIGQIVPDTEYWSLSTEFVKALGDAKEGDAMTLQGVALENPPTGFPVADAYPTFILPTQVSWNKTGVPRGYLWLSEVTKSVEGVIRVGVDFSNLQPPGSPPGVWGGVVTWYVSSMSQDPPNGPVVGGGTTKLSYSTYTGAIGEYWFSVTLEPQEAPTR